MGLSIRIFHFNRKPQFPNLLLNPSLIISPFSTLSPVDPFCRKKFVEIFQECSKEKALQPGKQAHACMIVSGFKPTLFVANRLLDMYLKCSHLESAGKLFDRMSERNAVSWTSLMSGYLQNGNCLKSVGLFVTMGRDVAYNVVPIIVVLKSCASLKDNVIGVQVHGLVVKSGFECDVVIGNAMLHMYAKCNLLDESLRFFDAMPLKSCVSWSAMIAGCVENDEPEGGVELFKRMQREGVAVSQHDYASVFKSCTDLRDSRLGSQLHGHALKSDVGVDNITATAILDMYAKCDDLLNARKVFILMCKKSSSCDVVTWTSMICAYARHRNGNEALQVFEEMLLEKVMPTHATFVGVLRACANIGLVNESIRYLHIMKTGYGLEPELEHYSCVVDALGRSGRITDALKLIQDMPLKANDVIWRSVLSNCKMQGNVEVGEIAATSLLELNPRHSAAYVLLSEIYADAGMWDKALMTRRIMRDHGLRQRQGCTRIVSSSI